MTEKTQEFAFDRAVELAEISAVLGTHCKLAERDGPVFLDESEIETLRAAVEVMGRLADRYRAAVLVDDEEG